MDATLGAMDSNKPYFVNTYPYEPGIGQDDRPVSQTIYLQAERVAVFNWTSWE